MRDFVHLFSADARRAHSRPPDRAGERIHALQIELASAFGDSVTVDGTTYYSFPRPVQLAAASESALRELGLGFRAPYVKETAEMVATDELTADDVRGTPYENAHEAVQAFPGVGPKSPTAWRCLPSDSYRQSHSTRGLDNSSRSTIQRVIRNRTRQPLMRFERCSASTPATHRRTSITTCAHEHTVRRWSVGCATAMNPLVSLDLPPLAGRNRRGESVYCNSPKLLPY